MTEKKRKSADMFDAILDHEELDLIDAETDEASDEAIHAELAKEGHTSDEIAAVFAKHEALVRSAAKPKETAASRKPSASRRAPTHVIPFRSRLSFLTGGFGGGLAVAAGIAAIYVASHGEPGSSPVPPVITAAHPPVGNTPEEMRQLAFVACATQRYRSCLDMFDKAKKRDPSGDEAEDIQIAREIAVSVLGFTRDAGHD